VLRGAGEPMGDSAGGEYRTGNKLVVNSMVSGGELVMQWSYSGRHYEEGTIGWLSEGYCRELEFLISHCEEQGKRGEVYTPSDYGLEGKVTSEELDRFMKEKQSNMENLMSF
jgi:non-ribosomal peptide synthase protein (TIGR01720 family)